MEGTVRRKLTFLFYVGMIFFLKRGRAGQWKGGAHDLVFSSLGEGYADGEARGRIHPGHG